jgi:hypothetical protein
MAKAKTSKKEAPKVEVVEMVTTSEFHSTGEEGNFPPPETKARFQSVATDSNGKTWESAWHDTQEASEKDASGQVK